MFILVWCHEEHFQSPDCSSPPQKKGFNFERFIFQMITHTHKIIEMFHSHWNFIPIDNNLQHRVALAGVDGTRVIKWRMNGSVNTLCKLPRQQPGLLVHELAIQHVSKELERGRREIPDFFAETLCSNHYWQEQHEHLGYKKLKREGLQETTGHDKKMLPTDTV